MAGSSSVGTSASRLAIPDANAICLTCAAMSAKTVDISLEIAQAEIIKGNPKVTVISAERKVTPPECAEAAVAVVGAALIVTHIDVKRDLQFSDMTGGLLSFQVRLTLNLVFTGEASVLRRLWFWLNSRAWSGLAGWSAK